MSGKLLNAGLVVLAALVLTVAGMWVFRLGPFTPKPSAAARELPKIEKAVGEATLEQAQAVAKADSDARDAGQAAEKRIERHVEIIRQRPVVVAPDIPDDAFFAGVCESKLYAGSPDCGGVRR